MGLGYAENDWILREVQERSSLAFRYAIDHSPLTTWRLVKPGGAGGGLETSKSRPNERKNIFSPKWLTTVQQKRDRKKRSSAIARTTKGRSERPHQTRWSWSCFKWLQISFFTPRCLTSYISSQTPACGFHTKPIMPPSLYDAATSAFFLSWPASPVWPTRDSVKGKNTPNFRGLKETLCANFLTAAVLDYTAATCTGRKATFPVKPIKLYSNGPDLLLSFFFSRLLLCNKT